MLLWWYSASLGRKHYEAGGGQWHQQKLTPGLVREEDYLLLQLAPDFAKDRNDNDQRISVNLWRSERQVCLVCAA